MKNCVIINQDGISYLQFLKLLEYENKVKHAITLKPFNICSNETYYNQVEEVQKNYKEICDLFHLDFKNIYRPYQAHTDNIKEIVNEKPGTFTKELVNIDGLITNQKNKILTIGTADCIDIFFFDPVKMVIANIHSGWRGTYKKISVKTIEKMINEYNCNVKDIFCFFGPSIRKCHFSVDKKVLEDFYNKFKTLSDIDEIVMGDKIDTILLNKTLLINKGLKEERIIDCEICTVCESEKFHSYRIDKNSGRTMGLISLI